MDGYSKSASMTFLVALLFTWWAVLLVSAELTSLERDMEKTKIEKLKEVIWINHRSKDKHFSWRVTDSFKR